MLLGIQKSNQSPNYFGELSTGGIHVWFDRCLDVLKVMHGIESDPVLFEKAHHKCISQV